MTMTDTSPVINRKAAELADEFLDLLNRTCDRYAELLRRLGPEYEELAEKMQGKPETEKTSPCLPGLVDALEEAIERYQRRKEANP